MLRKAVYRARLPEQRLADLDYQGLTAQDTYRITDYEHAKRAKSTDVTD